MTVRSIIIYVEIFKSGWVHFIVSALQQVWNVDLTRNNLTNDMYRK